eukprot:TRINITY_DN2840_c0_g1_i1.p1 TRINITY_DN2840_c0_g1~~TRINITY_DN2840_c0_g1_i1.p1  ORF type:complete len:683 (-),score=113.32 TRINITY_DN2840_c0_g1_i1:34-2082(-)
MSCLSRGEDESDHNEKRRTRAESARMNGGASRSHTPRPEPRREDFERTASLEDLAQINKETNEAMRKTASSTTQKQGKWANWKYFLPPLAKENEPKKEGESLASSGGAAHAHKKGGKSSSSGAPVRSRTTTNIGKSPVTQPRITSLPQVKPKRRETETFTVPMDIPPLPSSAYQPGVCVELRCLRDENTEGFADIAAAKSVNLYPMMPDSDTKLANPICDYFRFQVYGNRALAAVSDGCGWGFAPANAALLAGDTFVTYVKRKLPFIADLRVAGQVLMEGLTKAHDKIIADFADEEMFKVGTTTLCGGILLEIDRELVKQQAGALEQPKAESIVEAPADNAEANQEAEKKEDKDHDADLAGSKQSVKLGEHKMRDSDTMRSPKSASRRPSKSKKEKRKLDGESKSETSLDELKSSAQKPKSLEVSSVVSPRKKKGKEIVSGDEPAEDTPALQPAADQTAKPVGTTADEMHIGTDAQWVFLCAGVGDCKALHYSQQEKKLRDITTACRSDLFDSTDPGGRLGPYKGRAGDSAPDLRNLNIYYAVCEEDDLIIIVTDGVYDNYDPYHRGVPPRQLGLDVDKWGDLDRELALAQTGEFMMEKMTETFLAKTGGNRVTPHDVVISLTQGCEQLVRKSSQWMENNPNIGLPVNYAEYPGKMDHATCLCFRVGHNDFTSFTRREKKEE